DDGTAVAETAAGGLRVAGLLPGEEAEVEVAHRSPHTGAAWATIRRRFSAAAERVVPRCPGYGRCGGCVMQHLDYAAQLPWKGQHRSGLMRDNAECAVQISLVFAELPPEDRLAALVDLLRAQPQVASVVLHQNRRRGNVLLPGGEGEIGEPAGDRVLFGEP